MGTSNEEGMNRISLRVESEIFEKLDRKRFEEKTTFQEVGVGLFSAWMKGERDTPPGPEHELVTMAREYSEIAEPAEARSLKLILAGLIEHVHHRSKAKKRA